MVSNITPLPFKFQFSAVSTIATPRPFGQIDGRDINLDNILGDDYPGGTVASTGNRTARPVNAWVNWYRNVDVRLSRPLFDMNGKRVSFTAEAFNVFNFKNNLSYGGTQFTATGAPVSTFGVPLSSFGARQGQVGMKVEF